MPLHSTEAIIVGGHDLAEADRIVVFYTETLGKVRAVAEGARRIRSKFGGSLQLFTQGRLVYFERPNRTLHKVNEFAVIRSHQPLREDLDRIALGSTAVEAVSSGVEEGEAHPELYRLLAEGLDLLEAAARPALVLQGFMLHLLRLLGYRPEFAMCVRCHQPLPLAASAHISSGQGGLLCPGCRPGIADAAPVSAEALGFLRGAGGSSLRLMDRIAIPPQVFREVSDLLGAFLQHVLGRRLKSADFLSRL
ncbi:MAG TPA: DNA repair protein RecO [Candidatus Methylomirabilis sp.]|nr:DNA repair protein RecO [Candidatus Methylomirabilis sp.]